MRKKNLKGANWDQKHKTDKNEKNETKINEEMEKAKPRRQLKKDKKLEEKY